MKEADQHCSYRMADNHMQLWPSLAVILVLVCASVWYHVAMFGLCAVCEVYCQIH